MIATIVNPSVTAVQVFALIALVIFVLMTIVGAVTKAAVGYILLPAGLACIAAAILWMV